MSTIHQLQRPLAVGIMGALKPLRKLGLFGTSECPIEIEAGKRVPFWIEVRVIPFNGTFTFDVDIETFYDPEDGHQHIYPFEKAHHLMTLKNSYYALIQGAPTFVHLEPRKRKRPIKQLRYIHALNY